MGWLWICKGRGRVVCLAYVSRRGGLLARFVCWANLFASLYLCICMWRCVLVFIFRLFVSIIGGCVAPVCEMNKATVCFPVVSSSLFM